VSAKFDRVLQLRLCIQKFRSRRLWFSAKPFDTEATGRLSRWGSTYRTRCSPALMRSSNRDTNAAAHGARPLLGASGIPPNPTATVFVSMAVVSGRGGFRLPRPPRPPLRERERAWSTPIAPLTRPTGTRRTSLNCSRHSTPHRPSCGAMTLARNLGPPCDVRHLTLSRLAP
jgi:hypothetical protein